MCYHHLSTYLFRNHVSIPFTAEKICGGTVPFPRWQIFSFLFCLAPFCHIKICIQQYCLCIYNRVTNKKTRLCKNHAFWLSQRSDLCKTWREIHFFTLVGRALCKPKRRHSTGPEFIKKSKLICSFDSKHVRSTYVLDRWEKA